MILMPRGKKRKKKALTSPEIKKHVLFPFQPNPRNKK
jgi:hypothetical protein